jgi:hypothetical protein
MYSGTQAGSTYMNMPPSIAPQYQQPQQQFQYNNQYNPNPQQWQQQPPNMAYNYPNAQAYPPPSQYSYQQPYAQNPPAPQQFHHPYASMPQQPMLTPAPPPQAAAWIGSSALPNPNAAFANSQGSSAGARFPHASPTVGRAPATAPNMAARAPRRPPYIDPTTNIAYDVDNPDYEGWLTKQSAWMKVSTLSSLLLSERFTLLQLTLSLLCHRNGGDVILSSRAASCSFASILPREHPTV